MSRRSQQAVVSYVQWIIRWRWAVILLSLLSAFGLASGGRHLEFSNDYRIFFGEKNPQLRAFEALERIYTKSDSFLFVLQPEGRNVFDRPVLRAIKELTTAGWKVPYSTRVDSITNFQHTRAEGDDLIVEDLVSDPQSLTDEDLAKIRAIALDEPLLRRRLVSDDASTTGVNVRVYLPGKSLEEIPKAVAHVRKLADQVRATYPELRVELTGSAMLSNAFAEAPQADLKFLTPLMYGILITAMLVLLRSISATGATLGVVALSAVSAMGVAGWMGVKLNGVSVSAPTIILTLAIADSMHIILTMFGEMLRGSEKREALVESMRVNTQPVALTSLTTAIGFLSLNFSDAPPLRDLGNITAAGASLAWVYSMTLLPALLTILPLRPRQVSLMSRAGMERIGEFVIARRRSLLFWMSVLVVLLTAGMLRFEINDRPVEYFDDSIEFRRATDFSIANLAGFYGMDFSLDAEESGGISDPRYLDTVERFVAWSRARSDVSQVVALTDTMKRLNKNLHGDAAEYYRLPGSREMAAQYLLLYEMSLPYGLDLNDQINVDKSAVRVSVINADIDFRQLKQFKMEAQNWLRDHGLPSMRNAEGSSPAVMFAYISDRNIRAMVRGTFVAFALISLVLVVALRSVKIGTISLIPNLVPIGMAFGIWAYVWGDIDFAVSIVAAVSIGIIVDDTVHFLSKYLRARREQGLGSADAVRYAFRTVGSALWATSVILALGFGTLTFSSFWPNSTLGLLAAMSITMALFADFLFLPPLLMLYWDRSKSAE